MNVACGEAVWPEVRPDLDEIKIARKGTCKVSTTGDRASLSGMVHQKIFISVYLAHDLEAPFTVNGSQLTSAYWLFDTG